MSTSNQAAWLRGVKQSLEVGPADTGRPGKGELLVKNAAVSVNPVDHYIQAGGFPAKLPQILGNDIAGEIVEVGEDTPGFSKGQRVLAHTINLNSGKPEHGGFQQYTVVPVITTCPIPNDMKYEEAVVLPLALSTAAVGLFDKEILGLSKPSNDPEDSGKALLVWGGASSVGSAAIQLAAAAGLTVIATTSKSNFDFVKSLGASQVFDYHTPSIVGDLTAALQEYKLAGAYDAISTRDTQLNVAQVLAQLGGGNVATTLPAIDEAPATVNLKFLWATRVFDEATGVGKAIYHDFLPTALKSGQLQAAPKPHVVGHGLDQIQSAFDKHRGGVSAAKVVVTL